MPELLTSMQQEKSKQLASNHQDSMLRVLVVEVAQADHLQPHRQVQLAFHLPSVDKELAGGKVIAHPPHSKALSKLKIFTLPASVSPVLAVEVEQAEAQWL